MQSGFCGALIIFLQAGAGNPRFDAAVFSAVARRARKLVSAHPRQRVVAPFAGHAVRTAVHAAVDGDSAAAAGSENHRKHHVLAGSGTVAFERDKFDFCAAQIHANAKGIVFAKSHPACPLSDGQHSTPSASVREGRDDRWEIQGGEKNPTSIFGMWRLLYS